MKYFSLLLWALIPFIQLQAKTTDAPKYYESYWSGTDDELFFVIKLDDRLMFPDSYFPSSTEKELTCKIICTPKEDAPLIEGSPQLKEIQFSLSIKNCADPKKVSYTLKTTKLFKEQLEAGGVRTTSSTTTDTGFITNPSIDLTQEAYFSTSNKDPQKAYIVFKNSYPYSEL